MRKDFFVLLVQWRILFHIVLQYVIGKRHLASAHLCLQVLDSISYSTFIKSSKATLMNRMQSCFVVMPIENISTLRAVILVHRLKTISFK
jgi:hypothetical protein